MTFPNETTEQTATRLASLKNRSAERRLNETMGAKIVNINGFGPYCFKIHGQTCHQTSNLKPPDNLAPKYAQLYILDSAEATDYRMQLPENEKCLPIIMEKIDAIIRQHNIYAGTYKMMHEIEKEQTALAQIQNMTLPNIGLYLRRDRNLDVRRYNLPNCNEIAMVFVDDNGEPSFERDIRVYARPQTQNPLHNLKLNSLIDDITKYNALCRSVAHVYTIEFQKRGISYCHMLVILHPDDTFTTPEAIDKVVSAELPDPTTNPRLYKIV